MEDKRGWGGRGMRGREGHVIGVQGSGRDPFPVDRFHSKGIITHNMHLYFFFPVSKKNVRLGHSIIIQILK